VKLEMVLQVEQLTIWFMMSWLFKVYLKYEILSTGLQSESDYIIVLV